MRALLMSLAVVLATAGISNAKELPNAPSAEMASSSFTVATTETTVPTRTPRFTEKNPVDTKFVSLALISAGATFADSYTTLFARENWLAHKTGVCNEEVESAYLYGTHPTVARAYAVATVKSVGAVAAAYYLRKHHSKLWSLPLIGNTVMSLQGVTQNMIECN
jgi:hypothetical protein